MTRVAVASYDLRDTPEQREVKLWTGLEDVIHELVGEYDATREDLEDRIEYAIDAAFDNKAQAND